MGSGYGAIPEPTEALQAGVVVGGWNILGARANTVSGQAATRRVGVTAGAVGVSTPPVRAPC